MDVIYTEALLQGVDDALKRYCLKECKWRSTRAYEEVANKDGVEHPNYRHYHLCLTSGGVKPEGSPVVSFHTPAGAVGAYCEQLSSFLFDKQGVVLWRCRPEIREDQGMGKYYVYSRLTVVPDKTMMIQYVPIETRD